ncbi:MAG TPA: carbon-nitrogen hydrolase family protein [Gemmatimonadaceae bacterium]|nr:carbon-nitrogen hydrolase family protein [Gemmatimonadaceae bacterium]
MRITVCELPHDPGVLDASWAALCRHTRENSSELVLLPEFAMVEPVWETELFDAARWSAAEALTKDWIERFGELGAPGVVATRPSTVGGRRYNEGYLWSAAGGLTPLRRKYFLPTEPGNWESCWFERGDPDFSEFHAGSLCFGLNICTELWALDTYSSYADGNVQVILSPRATAASTLAKWQSAGVVAAVRSGAFSVSSNRVDPTGACGGVGWIIGPDGRTLASTSAEVPFATVEIDPAVALAARHSYPRYIFGGAH